MRVVMPFWSPADTARNEPRDSHGGDPTALNPGLEEGWRCDVGVEDVDDPRARGEKKGDEERGECPCAKRAVEAFVTNLARYRVNPEGEGKRDEEDHIGQGLDYQLYVEDKQDRKKGPTMREMVATVAPLIAAIYHPR